MGDFIRLSAHPMMGGRTLCGLLALLLFLAKQETRGEWECSRMEVPTVKGDTDTAYISFPLLYNKLLHA